MTQLKPIIEALTLFNASAHNDSRGSDPIPLPTVARQTRTDQS